MDCVHVIIQVVIHSQIVTEYERAVILRLGRLTSRRAKGPGINILCKTLTESFV